MPSWWGGLRRWRAASSPWACWRRSFWRPAVRLNERSAPDRSRAGLTSTPSVPSRKPAAPRMNPPGFPSNHQADAPESLQIGPLNAASPARRRSSAVLPSDQTAQAMLSRRWCFFRQGDGRPTSPRQRAIKTSSACSRRVSKPRAWRAGRAMRRRGFLPRREPERGGRERASREQGCGRIRSRVRRAGDDRCSSGELGPTRCIGRPRRSRETAEQGHRCRGAASGDARSAVAGSKAPCRSREAGVRASGIRWTHAQSGNPAASRCDAGRATGPRAART